MTRICYPLPPTYCGKKCFSLVGGFNFKNLFRDRVKSVNAHSFHGSAIQTVTDCKPKTNCTFQDHSLVTQYLFLNTVSVYRLEKFSVINMQKPLTFVSDPRCETVSTQPNNFSNTIHKL